MEIILRTQEEVNQFLLSKGIQEISDEYTWVCPKCLTENLGAYFSHETPCVKCKKFAHPRLGEIADHGAEAFKDIKKKLRDQEQEIRDEIREFEDALAEKEEDLLKIQKEIELMEKFMRINNLEEVKSDDIKAATE